MPNQICFMVMPFGKKRTKLNPNEGPAEIDFDSLWEHAYKPLLEEAGYEAVRADAQSGSLIIQDMIEGLAFSDLVMADVSIPNANVYYEIGVRHSARSKGCVLVSASWANPVFDLRQIRRLTFELNQTTVDELLGSKIKADLQSGFQSMIESKSPVVEIIPQLEAMDEELSNDLGQARSKEFREKLKSIQDLQADIFVVAQKSGGAQKREAALELKKKCVENGRVLPSIQIELMKLLRDSAAWEDEIKFIDEEMDEDLRNSPLVQEQRLLALSKTDSNEAAAGHLEMLIKNHGPSAERYGLLGGRYKRMFQDAKNEIEAGRYLERAIQAYQNGMNQDLNAYYPTCNLPPLLRHRNKPGDEELAKFAQVLTVSQCARARTLGIEDEWLNPTLLTNAFSAQDCIEAEKWVAVVEIEGAVAWKLESTIETIENGVECVSDGELKEKLRSLVARLKSLLV